MTIILRATKLKIIPPFSGDIINLLRKCIILSLKRLIAVCWKKWSCQCPVDSHTYCMTLSVESPNILFAIAIIRSNVSAWVKLILSGSQDKHFASTLMSMSTEPRKTKLERTLINILGPNVYFIHSPQFFFTQSIS